MRLLPKGLLLTVVFLNIALIAVGPLFATATLGSPTGVGILAADIGLQLTLAAVGLFGPLSLAGLGDHVGYPLVMGVAFALTYDGLLILDFAGQPVALNPLALFLTTALAASVAVSYRSRRVTQGMLAAAWSLLFGTALWSGGFMITAYAFWGTHHAYLFWMRDGAVAEFHHSGGSSLSVFLLRDIEGALFFHPLLSLVLGLLLGAAGGAVGLLGAGLRHQPATEAS